MRTLLNKIRKLLKDRRTRRLWSRTISVVAALVVFVTTYALVLPAITMERQAYCGLEAHQHTDECFERRLICTIPESPGHHHGDSCYTMRQEYSCTLEEHIHTDGCYDEEGNLICEIPEHTHEEGTCWQEVPELTCTLEESDGHQHGDACYENVLVCGKEVHTHSEACYENPDELLETAAVATTQEGAYGISSEEGFDGSGTDGSGDSDGSGDEIGWTDSDDYGNAARSDAALSDDPSTGLTDPDNAANSINAAGSDAAELDAAGADAMSEEAQQDLTSGGISEEEDRYVPQLDPLAFDTALNKHTGIYYYHVREGETVEDSSLITEWEKVEKNTKLGPNDLLRVYLSYTIPAGSLNETNPTAVYRLPASLHLTDDQVNGINAIENGIAAAYIDYSTLTVTDPDNYHRYLGAEAVEGTRTPDQTLAEYLAQSASGSGNEASGNQAGQEFISATVRAQNVYDTEGRYGEKGAYLGQDLVFTFSPYTIEKNQHTYDASGQPARAGEKIRGWFAIDFNLTQVDLDEPYIEEVENIENIERIEAEKNRGNENADENTGDENTAVSDDGGDTTVLVSREFRTANIVFVEKDTSRNLDEISASIKVVTAENYERVEANPDDVENIENVENSEDNGEENGEEQPEENAEGIEEDLTGQEAETGEDATDADSEDKSDADAPIMPAMSFEDSIRVRTGKPAGVEDGSAGSAAASAAEALPRKAKVIVRVEADEGTFPAGTTMVLSAVEDLDAVAETVKEAVENGDVDNNGNTTDDTENKNPKTYGFQAVDISFRDADGNEIEPVKPVRVALTSEIVEQIKADKEADSSTPIADPVVVHVDDVGNAQKMELIAPEEIEPAQGKTEEELQEEMEKAQAEAEKAALEEKEKAAAEQEEKEREEADGQTSGPDQAVGNNPGKNVMEGVNENPVQKETNDQDQSAVEVNEKVDGNQGKSQENTNPDDQPTAGEDTENAPSEEPTVFFDTDSFSVYAIVYTVDFHFAFDGKDFTFKLNGADAISFSRLAEVLGIAESYAKQPGKVNEDAGNETGTGEDKAFIQEDGASEDGTSGNQNAAGENVLVTADELAGDAEGISEATKQFLEQVETVEFSDPELLWVGRIEEDVTTGALLQKYELVPEFPYGTTANDFGDYAARQFSAPDWVLISLKPFDTEESLTITMKNGDVVTVTVTDAADAVMIDDGEGGRVVQTITNPSGTTIDLFDYWITNNLRYSQGMNGWPGHRGDAYSSYQFDHYNYYGQQQNGDVPMSQDPNRNNDWYVNSGSLRGNGNNQGINNDHAFKFYPGAAGTVVDYGRKGSHTDWTNNHDQYTSINSWTGDADPTTGLIVGYLDGGYPWLTNNSNLGTDGSSLAYLFNDTSHSGKQKYGEVDNLLYVDSEGYYTYDSRYYSASYDPAQGNGGNFVLREHASNAAQAAKGFWPFGSRVNWHGMHMNTQFSMPTNGKVLNPNGEYKDMQFEFSGDDDTWLYIDGILVGDGGGIHNRTEIDINFATGTVIVTGTKDDNHQGTFTSTTTLRAIFEAAEHNGRVPAGYVAANFETGSNTFKAGTYHTFDMFYLERGGSESNLYIRYNLVSTADFTAHKSYHSKDGSRLERDEFKFELIGLDGRYESVPDGTDDEGNPKYKLVEASWSNDTYSLPQNNRAVMPSHNAAATSGAGTVASPYYDPDDTELLSNGSSVAAQLYRTGVSEDGNVNFGQAEISEAEKYAKEAGHASVYRYIIREYVPADAVNADGIKWSEASDEAKLEGGFTLGDVTYDGTIYYMAARIISWEETNATGQTVTRYGLAKTYYTDDTYTTEREDVDFASFLNGYVQPLTLKVVKKSDSGKMLSGATFTLTHAMQNEEEKWVPRQYVRDDVTVTAAARTATTSQGVLTFDNLTEGHYILEETVAPAGYEKSSPSKWLLSLTKKDTATRILLEPSIRPLNADGSLQEGIAPTILTVANDNTFQYEVINGKIPRGDIEVTKKWLRADGTTAYTPEEIAQLGDDVQNTTITGELWRRYQTEVTVQNPTVTIYAKLNNQSSYTQKWQGQIEYGSDILYSMAVNSTGYPLRQTVSTGAVPVAAPDQDITYDNGIRKPSGHVYALQNVTEDTQIYADFDSSKANNLGIGFYLVSKVDPSAQSQTTTDLHTEKVGDFTLNNNNGWTVTWTSADLAEQDYDYEYYFQNVTESALEGFTFVGTPEAVTDPSSGKVTYSYKNISKGEQTDLTVRKIWIDGNDNHSGDTISYKIQRAEYDLSGTLETEPYDYIPAGQTSAQIYTLSSSDVYNGVSWQKHHDDLPADSGKAESDPDYRLYRYSVVEIVPEGYTVTYSSLTDSYEETSYDVKLIRNTPTENKVGVEKKWMDAEQSGELTEGIPEGVYITGTLKRDYTHVEASGVTVNVYFRSWSEGHTNPAQLYRSYTDVRQGTVFSLWAVDADGVEPIHGVTVNDRQIEQSGETKTFHGSSWEKTTNAFVTTVTGDTEIILEWYDNTAYQTAVYYDVSYTQETGSGQAQSGTETVGTFRLDELNNWTRMWTDSVLNEAADRNYSYYITDIQEHRADGTVVDHYDGFQSPAGGVMTYDPAAQKWSAVIINSQEPEEVPFKIRKLKEGTEEPLAGAIFTLIQVDRNGNNVAGGIVRGPSPTDENGELTFDGIVPGRYKLAETPPAGYIKVEGDYFINVTAGGEDTIEGEPLYIDYELANDGTHLYTVENTPGAALPHTGGLGTNLIYICGILLTGLAGAGLMMKRRRRKAA